MIRRVEVGGAETKVRNVPRFAEVPEHVASLPGTPSRPSGIPAILAAVVVILGTLALHVPYYAITPGPAQNVPDLISLSGAETTPVSGKLLLTTVSLFGEIRLIDAVYGLFDQDFQVISRSAIIPAGETDRDVEQRTTQQMQESQVYAAAAALSYLGYKVPIVPTGVRVEDVEPGAPAATKLHTGDVIVGADGSVVHKHEEFTALVRRHRVGDEIVLKVVRGGKAVQVRTRTIASERSASVPIVGIFTSEVAQVGRLPLAVKIDSLGIGGPSAGLMFALGIVDLLNKSDLVRGRTVAGTGEITVDGVVKPVGGVRQKIVGAKDAHANLFLVPSVEVLEACEAARGDLPIYAVDNLKQAVAVLGNTSQHERKC
jgi:Lon-like protease